LHCEISFQDPEKVLNLAKMYISIEKVWKFQIQTYVYSNTAGDSFANVFCIVFHKQNFGNMKVRDN